MRASACAALLAAVTVNAQQIGTSQAENHPPLTTYECSGPDSCTPDST